MIANCHKHSLLISWLVFTIFVLLTAFYSQSSMSGWILMNQPFMPVNAANPIYGYSELLGNALIHKENFWSMDQAVLFSEGWSQWISFYYLRCIYPLIISVFQPFIGYLVAAKLVNIACWLGGGLVATLLAGKLSDDAPVARISALTLVGGGAGWLIHVSDYSPHILSFLTYYIGAYALLTRDELYERHGFKWYLTAGILFGLLQLTYSTNLYLLLTLFLLSLRRGNISFLLLTLTVAIAIPMVWNLELVTAKFAFHVLKSGFDTNFIDFFRENRLDVTESSYLKRSTSSWLSHLASFPDLAREVWRIILQFVTFDSPASIIAATLSLALGWKKLRRVILLRMALLFFLPIAGSMVWAEAATARGYLVYGGSIITYSLTAWGLAQLVAWSARQSRPWLGWSCVLIVLGGHLAWNSSFLLGSPATTQGYFSGLNGGFKTVLSAPPQLVSLTGLERPPATNLSSFREAGMIDQEPAPLKPRISSRGLRFAAAFASRTFPFTLILLLALLSLPADRKRKSISMLIAALFILPPMASWAFGGTRAMPTVIFDESIRLRQPAHYDVEIGRPFFDALDHLGSRSSRVEVMLPIAQHAEFRLIGAASPCPETANHCETTLEQLETYLAHSKVLTVGITPTSDEAVLCGWQRNGLPGRRFDASSPILPALEIRVLSEAGNIVLLGF